MSQAGSGASPTETAEAPDPQRWSILAVVVIAQLMVVNTALTTVRAADSGVASAMVNTTQPVGGRSVPRS
jgi:hypothetical protein